VAVQWGVEERRVGESEGIVAENNEGHHTGADQRDKSGLLPVVVTWRVRQGSEREFEAWRREISADGLNPAVDSLRTVSLPWLCMRGEPRPPQADLKVCATMAVCAESRVRLSKTPVNEWRKACPT
jgi:hypothetical protein